MNRRAFLSLLASGLVGTAADVDRLLWVPGEKTIFLPPAPTLVSNTLVTPEWIVREVLDRLTHNLTLAESLNRSYDKYLVGATVTARFPVRYQIGAR